MRIRKMPPEIEELTNQLINKQAYKNNEFNLLHKKDFINNEELFRCLRDNAINLRQRIAENKTAKSNGKVYHADDIKLSFKDVADILKEHLYAFKTAKDETARVAVYNYDNGLYMLDYSFLKDCIFQISDVLPVNMVDNVIYNLKRQINYDKATKDKNLVAVGNGIFDIQNKVLLDFSPKYKFMSKVATNYNDKARKSPEINGWQFEEWLKLLSSNKDNELDKEIYQLLWQVIADSLNGNYSHLKLIALYSQHGASGKGTYQTIIKNLVGSDNIGTLKVNEFGERFSLSRILNKSVVIGDDNPVGYIKDSSSLNSVITGDLVNIEFKGETGFTAEMSPTIIQSFNELPSFSNKGGTDRRLLIVPFYQNFQSNNRREIKDEYAKRKDVLEHILYVALNDYGSFDKYIEPRVSKELLEEFKIENDNVKAFINDQFIKWHVRRIPVQTVYNAYKIYCSKNGYQALSNKQFSKRAINSLDIYKIKTSRINKDIYKELKELVEDNRTDLYKGYNLSFDNKPIKCFIAS